jgi:hypothetical protein
MNEITERKIYYLNTILISIFISPFLPTYILKSGRHNMKGDYGGYGAGLFFMSGSIIFTITFLLPYLILIFHNIFNLTETFYKYLFLIFFLVNLILALFTSFFFESEFYKRNEKYKNK